MRRSFHDLASLVARLGVGGLFLADGWQKLEAGLTATGGWFAALGAPGPGAWAATTMLAELVGGALLVTGIAVPVCGLLLFGEVVAVSVLTAGARSLPPTGDEVSLTVALAAASLLLAAGGAGRLSIDHVVVVKRRRAGVPDDFAPEPGSDDVIAALRQAEAAESAPSARAVAVPASGTTGTTGTGTDEPATVPAGAPGGETRKRTLVRPRPRGSRAETPKAASPSAGSGDILVAGGRSDASGG